MAATHHTPAGPYALRAYVGGADQVIRCDPYGRVTFAWIYRNRPDECRYAVAGEYDLTTGDDRYIVWDLYAATRDPFSNTVQAPKPRLTHDDLDAAIMATVLLYGS